MRLTCRMVLVVAMLLAWQRCQAQDDYLRQMQHDAVEHQSAAWGHWGYRPNVYSSWTDHSNRLVPVYTFGIDLNRVKDGNSVYRDEQKLRELYGYLPEQTLNPHAEYFDQTDVHRLQKLAVDQGKKFIFLIIFDGLDWQTTQAAAIYRTQQAAYAEGRGRGLSFLDYRGAVTDFGCMVSSPQNESAIFDVNAQLVTTPATGLPGGYDSLLGGDRSWSTPGSVPYLLSLHPGRRHAFTDSASSATSMTAGIKTYNKALNVDGNGTQVEPLARTLQQRGWSVGTVTSVPISHATPASAYANNVSRDDYQDLTRDMLGLASVSHRDAPLSGLDVVIGCGWGSVDPDGKTTQGENFVPGAEYITDGDLNAVKVENGGKYRVVQRTVATSGTDSLLNAAQCAADQGQRLLGLFGTRYGHLPFQTADGRFNPTKSVRGEESYEQADLLENPTLADMTKSALIVVEKNPKGFWLMIEAGDVDWANHANNIDNSIGAVYSGEAAFDVVVQWIEKNQCWDQSAVILTSDHGHMLVLTDPQRLIAPNTDQTRN